MSAETAFAMSIPPRLDSAVGTYLQEPENLVTRADICKQMRRQSSPNFYRTISEPHQGLNSKDRPFSLDKRPNFPLADEFRRQSLQTIQEKDDLYRLRTGSTDNAGLVHRVVNNGNRKQSLVTGFFKSVDMSVRDPSVSSRDTMKIKLVMLGDSGVGKSTFLRTLLTGKYATSSPSNLTMASVTKVVMHKDREVQVEFQDTAGQEKYRSLTTSYYRHSHGGFLFFNVYNKDSFRNIEMWIEDVDNHVGRDRTSLLLVGLLHKPTPPRKNANTRQVQGLQENGSCNTHGFTEPPKKRVVQREQAEHMASMWSIPYIEVDIRNDHQSILTAVHALIDLVMQSRFSHIERKAISIGPNNGCVDANKPCVNCCGLCKFNC